MKFLNLENDQMPVVGLGTWQLTGTNCVDAIKYAIESGYTHIDTADMYENHREVRKGIEGFDRDKLFITTKIKMPDFSEPRKTVNRFLSELGLNYINLVLLHWPDSNQDMISTLKELQKMKQEGIIKHFGVSNFTVNHLKELIGEGIVPEVNQVEYHPLLNQGELLAFCKKNGIVLTAYSPLGRGKVLGDERIAKISEKYEKSVAQVILRWHIQKGMVVIPKASSKEHIKDNIDIFDFELSDEDMNSINSINENDRVVNPPFSEFDY